MAKGAYRNADGEIVYPPIRPASQLVERRWEPLCPRTGAVLTPIRTTEEKPLVPTSVYAVTKQDQEQFCLVVGRAYRHTDGRAAYFNVYGTRQALSNPYTGVCAIFSSRLLNDQKPGGLRGRRADARFRPRQRHRSGQPAGARNRPRRLPGRQRRHGQGDFGQTVMKMLAEGLGKEIEPEITGKYREGDIRHCVADITRARAARLRSRRCRWSRAYPNCSNG